MFFRTFAEKQIEKKGRQYDRDVRRLKNEVVQMDEKIKAIIEAAKLYETWARETGDYPHDEQGCIAHEAILDAVRAYEQSPTPSTPR